MSGFEAGMANWVGGLPTQRGQCGPKRVPGDKNLGCWLQLDQALGLGDDGISCAGGGRVSGRGSA